MDDTVNGNFGAYSNNSYKTNLAPDKHDLKNLESTAKSLIQDILSACSELKLIKYQIVGIEEKIQKALVRTDKSEHMADAAKKLQYQLQNLEQHNDALKQKISYLCHDLESAKDTLSQAKHSMEANAYRLESQRLNNPTAELKLKRAAEIAWVEVERLTQLIAEIDEIMAQAVENMDIQIEQPDKSLYLHNRIHFSEKQPQVSDIELILAGFDAAHGTPSRKQDFYALPFPISKQEPPTLGSASSSGLEASLQKIPPVSPDRVEIHADSYSGGLYINDANSGRKEVGYDPYDLVSGPMAKGALSGGSIMAQTGFDGKYIAFGPGGVTTTFLPDVVGGW